MPGPTISLAALAVAVAAGLSAFAAPGDIDGTFGTQGVVSIDAGASDDLRALTLAPDGAIIAVGRTIGPSDSAGMQVVRRLPDGAVDASFAGGRVGVEFGGEESAAAVALQPDGKIVAAGTVRLPGGLGLTQMAVARLTPTGLLDAAPGGIATALAAQGGIVPGGLRLGFDDDGRKLIDIAGRAEAYAVRVLPDGRILVAGTGGMDVAVVRLLADGSTDTSFGTGGVARVNLGDADEARAMVVLADGRILLAANRTRGIGSADGSTAHLIRLLPGGARDPAFGQAGVAVLGAGQADALVRLSDGAIVVAGRAATTPGAVAAWRTGPQGVLDGGFGTNGRAVVALGGDASTGARALAVQADGKLVMAATLTEANQPRGAYVLRLQPGGIADTTFANGGQRVVFPTNMIGGSPVLVANAVALQADGRILVAGSRGLDLTIGRLEGDPPAPGTPPIGGGPPTGGTPVAGGGPVVGGGAPAAGSAVPRCAGRRATIVGTARRDVLRGTPRADVIVGLGGADVISGLAGADVICGGAGNDVVLGGTGADRLLGQAGRDILRGGAGRDILTGGAGRDLCDGGLARDRAPACERRRAL